MNRAERPATSPPPPPPPLRLPAVALFLDVDGTLLEIEREPGAVHVPFWRFAFGVPRGIPAGGPVVVYCGHGPRAHFARAMLRAHGVPNVACLAGHMAGWRRAGLPVERA